MITHASLFSGIGGFDYAAKIKGWQNLFHCEIDSFCQAVLKYHFPNSFPYADITKTDFTFWRRKIDVLSGGFPCQPYSQAGKRLGKADERHLWPQMLRAIKEIQPTYVVGENVYGIVNWNGGMVFDEVQTDLENQGYEVLPVILPAAGVNAPHKRDRTFFIAYRENGNAFVKKQNSRRQYRDKRIGRKKMRCKPRNISLQRFATNCNRQRCNGRRSNWQKRHLQSKQKRQSTQVHTNRTKHELKFSEISQTKYATYTNRIRRRRLPNKSQTPRTQQSHKFFRSARRVQVNANAERIRRTQNNRQRKPKQPDQNGTRTNWRDFPTQSPICSRNDELSARLHNITFSKWRRESIKAYGNAVVPELVLRIFNVVEKMMQQHNY